MKSKKQTLGNSLKKLTIIELKSVEKSILSDIEESKSIINDSKELLKDLNKQLSEVRRGIIVNNPKRNKTK